MKNTNTIKDQIEYLASQIGWLMMVAATMIGLLELHASRARVSTTLQPAYATVSSEGQNRVEELIRREKEENTHALVSYGTTMRSHPTTGKR